MNLAPTYITAVISHISSRWWVWTWIRRGAAVPRDEDCLKTTFLNAAPSTYPNRLPELLSDTVSNSTARNFLAVGPLCSSKNHPEKLCIYVYAALRLQEYGFSSELSVLTSPLQMEELIDSDLWAIRIENIWYLAYWSAKWFSLTLQMSHFTINLKSSSSGRFHSLYSFDNADFNRHCNTIASQLTKYDNTIPTKS